MPDPPAATATPATARGGMVRAAVYGLAAAVAGAGLDAAVSALWGGRVPIVPWVVGLGVGLAVRRGRGGRGGWAGQVLAVLLTYAAVVAGHLAALPGVWAFGLDASWPTVLFLLSLPVQRELNGVFGLAMILLGLIQAGRLNRRARGHRDRIEAEGEPNVLGSDDGAAPADAGGARVD